jgi:hypothetical protein
MSSITRKKLARGTKLYTEQVAGPLASAATALSGRVSPDQIKEPKTTFRVNLNVPYVDSDMWGWYGSCYSIPFTLPPFQQDFDITAGTPRQTPNTYKYSPSSPRFYINELSFGFNQRDESCVIADKFFNWEAATNGQFDGEMNFNDITKLNLRLSIFEHKMLYWDKEEVPGTATKSDQEAIQRELWSAKIPNVAYAGKDQRLNPLLIENIDLEISPHKTYVFLIHAPELQAGGDQLSARLPSYALSGIQISLKIRTDLVARDTVSADGVQNMPTKHNGVKTDQTVSVTTPAAGSVITADQAGGLSKNLAVIDDVFRDKLKSGYTSNSETVPNQNLLSDSGYEVIAVPLFQNARCGTIKSTNIGWSAYHDSGAAIGSQFIADRRIIPIEHPFVLHHVVLAWNWQNSSSSTSAFNVPNMVPPTVSFRTPSSSGFTADVGVAVATGLESDSYTYQQVAKTIIAGPDYTAHPASTWFSKCFDRVRTKTIETGDAQIQTTSSKLGWDWELHQVPLEGSGGAGYFAQGKPIFIGKGWSPTWARTNMAATGAPNTAGAEQFIEVRMRIRDTAEKTGPGSTGFHMYTGYQGHWVYLIGKKALV